MPNRILREGILTSERVNSLPEPSSLSTEAEILALRESLPRVHAGHPLQAYKHGLAMRLRVVRGAKITASTARRLIAESGHECPLCSRDMRFYVCGLWKTIDHIKPLSQGGTSQIENLRVICNSCNSSKGGR